MTLLTPPAAAAATTLADPSTLTRSIGVGSARQKVFTPAAWYTTEQPWAAGARLAGSSTSPTTGSAPRPRRARAASADLASARTGRPAATSASTRAPPMNPLPPVTRTGPGAVTAGSP